ncbi:hypothetical protein BFJ69_g15637 [Fusarium oxysporum]|uniref:ABC transporter domain-containing protein n=3 Tax=Fusarium oxysporum TaxID=5507 RepID=A0A420MDP5_FUSOX|nr:hypothetical protein BFJ66_g17357 [Fusarium oxysporum f. sp. cepae]RKK66173.1 hypothetical protein BFJ69_g15637 [Fusarium oxysporum]
MASGTKPSARATPKMAFLRQTWTLTVKNWKLLVRQPVMVVVVAFAIPIALTIFLRYARNFLLPPAQYGVADPRPIMSLPDAFRASKGHDTVVFVDNGFTGGEIERVINSLVASVQQEAGMTAKWRRSPSNLAIDCRSSLRGVTPCYGAVIFHSSPSEGHGGLWNYTLRSDSSLSGLRIKVNDADNDAQVFLLPLQRAVDRAITVASGSSLPDRVDEYPFTSMTQKEHEEVIRRKYQNSIINFAAVALMSSVILVTYHMTGFIATERESGMTQLIDAMMSVKHRWLAQAARIVSYHVSFSALYLPGWVITAIIMRVGIFTSTSIPIVLFYHILAGLSMASFSILAASVFNKAQMSGSSAFIVACLLGILAQSLKGPDTSTVAILSFFFVPCNYVYSITNIARFEADGLGANLTHVAPHSTWQLSGIVLWIFLIIQIITYPLLGAIIESYLYGTTAKGRTTVFNQVHINTTAVSLEGFTKVYTPSWFRQLFSFISKPRDTVVAVNSLSLSARRGQILALLGANGSGKSTTLDSISGTTKLTSGSITIDGTGGLGIAPQRNVLWDDLSVEQHLEIFNCLKSPGHIATRQEIRDLIKSVDLEAKHKSLATTLSGGQKRKLQLGMMLTGGSAVCCVDEVSSGLDPLSRRKIWDILLAERGRRTIILTTHFLDEADLLADHIAILSKGTLRADGSSAELKERLGGGHRVQVHKSTRIKNIPDVDGVRKETSFDAINYIAPTSRLATKVIQTLEAHGVHDYRFSGPTIEDVFLKLAEEIRDESEGTPQDEPNEIQPALLKDLGANVVPGRGIHLLDGKRIGFVKQTWVLLCKRLIILKKNWIPHLTALLLPVAAAGLVTMIINGQKLPGCMPGQQEEVDSDDWVDLPELTWNLVVGPTSRFNLASVSRVSIPALSTNHGASGSTNGSQLAAGILQNITRVATFDSLKQKILEQRSDIIPGGLWLGDAAVPPTVAYRANLQGLASPLFAQNFLNMALSNVTISMKWEPLDTPWQTNTGDFLQFLIYTVLALVASPAFFALYPTLESRSMVRSLQYSNGVRPLPLWLAYLAFDFTFVLVSTALLTILWAALSTIWYHIGYVFLVLILYGLASILLAYVVSLFAKTQINAYSYVTAVQVVFFLVYLIAYMATLTYAPVASVDKYLRIVHFVISAFAPIVSATRAIFLTLNLFSAACDGPKLSSNPGNILQYGGPIIYLTVQSFVLVAILLYADGGSPSFTVRGLFQRHQKEVEDTTGANDEEFVIEPTGATSDSGDDGLRVMHLTKAFGKNTVVDNVTFSVRRGEVFALLGPNGAGKSTTISLVRGELKPSRKGGDIFIEGISVISDLPAARLRLGVCPQHDATDLMTVREHLEFYARVRGIPDIQYNVNTIIHAVGLQAFSNRMAHTLSGGNKRKLSLGIALMGNPTVILLDEPSSGLDAAAKRVMWKTLARTIPGRSILLTTHSMEEADALANRVGILAKHMLALGSTDNLRQRFGDALHVHLISKTAPHTTTEETARFRQWVTSTFPGAEIEEKTYHGQMRFTVPASEVLLAFGGQNAGEVDEQEGNVSNSAVGQLAVMLEDKKDALGIMHYSVSPTTLDNVFLTIVGRHNIQEEGYRERSQEKTKAWYGGVFERKRRL